MTEHRKERTRRTDNGRLEQITESVYTRSMARMVVTVGLPAALAVFGWFGYSMMRGQETVVQDIKSISRSAAQTETAVESLASDQLRLRGWVTRIQGKQNDQQVEIGILKSKVP